MSVSGELLCSFELLKPLDSSALKSHIKKGRNKRQSMLNSPVSGLPHPRSLVNGLQPSVPNESIAACYGICTELLGKPSSKELIKDVLYQRVHFFLLSLSSVVNY